MSGLLVPPQPLDVVSWVTVRLHANGTVSTQGTIADKKLALKLLDTAKEAVERQVPDPEKPIIIPNREVDVSPRLPLREHGCIPQGERGDP